MKYKTFSRDFLLWSLVLLASSCTKSGSFNISDVKTEDPNVTVSDLNKLKAEMIGKKITIEKFGENLRVSFEGEPDVMIFHPDSEYSSVTNYVYNSDYGKFTLQFSHIFSMIGLREISITKGRIFTYQNGHISELEFD